AAEERRESRLPASETDREVRYVEAELESEPALICPNCNSDKVTIQAVTNVRTKRRGCLGWLFWIVLALCTFFLIIIIPILINGGITSWTSTEAICQRCGNRWRVK
ncbi:MAG: hypothetical protein FWG74_09045, partial [Planctomycetes bacterium]|nr:hypothetical protein [Planctomycetota bacterium]